MGNQMNYSSLWGIWHITGLIGEGPRGRVYRVVSMEGGKQREAAVKQMTVPAVQGDGAEALYERVVQAVQRETAFYRRLQGHSNLVSYAEPLILPAPEGGYEIFLRMERLESLPAYAARKPLTEADIINLGLDICTALRTFEDEGHLHRNLKPSNILVTQDGQFCLSDFATTREADQAFRCTGVPDTVNFTAPELLRGDSVGHSADLYSLGMILYQFCNGLRGPFLPASPAPVTPQAASQAQQRRLQGEPLPLPSGVSAPLGRILCKACAYRPEDRYQSADALYRALMALKSQATRPPVQRSAATAQKSEVRAPAHSQQQKPRRSTHLYVLIAVLGVCLLAVIGLCIYLLTSGGDTDPTEPPASLQESVSDSPSESAPASEQPSTSEPTQPLTEPATEAPATEEPTSPTLDLELHYDYIDFSVPASGYVIEDSSTRYITEEELHSMTEHQCCIARNEIFARHGRIFLDERIADYFNALFWYNGTISPETFDADPSRYLNAVEIANVNLIRQYELRVYGG